MTNPAPEDSYVLFLDLLCFGDTVDAWQANGRRDQVIDLVRYISTAQSDYKVTTTATGSTLSMTIRPAITTFSDSVVVSVPVTSPPDAAARGYADQVLGIWKPEVLKLMAEIAARISIKALPLQLLIRGGLASGELVHTNNYIIGPGLNEAYRLESKIADVPRIVVAEHLYESALDPSILRKDADDKPILNYILALEEEVRKQRSDHDTWREIRRQEIAINIERASNTPKSIGGAQPRATHREKWEWFLTYFDKGTFGL